MLKGSEELTNARKEEMINACASLYKTIGFRDITIRDIGAKTSFTRTSIYNYFQTKEEIFLALFARLIGLALKWNFVVPAIGFCLFQISLSKLYLYLVKAINSMRNSVYCS